MNTLIKLIKLPRMKENSNVQKMFTLSDIYILNLILNSLLQIKYLINLEGLSTIIISEEVKLALV